MSHHTTCNKCCPDPCGTPCPCNCNPQPCPPTPCTTGCLHPNWGDCLFLSKDLTVCADTILKGTSFTDVFESFAQKLCGNIVVTATDIRVKASASDSTSGYLSDKIVGSSSVSILNTNVGLNEQLVAAVRLSATSNNCLQILSDGLYMACPSPSTASTTLVGIDTNTVDTTVLPTVGGYSVQSLVKIDTTPGNAIQVGPNGLYVAPPTTSGPATTVSGLDTSSVDITVTPSGNNYQVSAQVRFDPASAAPITYGPNGINIGCCPSGNTLLTTANSPSVGHTLTPILGGYNLSSQVILDPSGTNALQVLPTGLYVPMASGAVSISDTDTVNMTILPGNIIKSDVIFQNTSSVTLSSDAAGIKADVNIDTLTGGNILVNTGNGLYVPSSPVSYSTDTCNAAQAGTDGGVFVQSPLLAYGLRLYNDGTNFIFEFSGHTSINTDYEVEFRGTTGSPLTWINGDANYVSVASGILKYNMTAFPSISCDILGARVRAKCTNGDGEWASIMLNPSEDIHFTSSDNSISIVQDPSGTDCGLIDLKLQSTNPCATVTAPEISFVIQNDGDDTNLLVGWLGANDDDMVSVKVDYTNVSGNPAHVIALVSTYNPTFAKTVVSMPFFGTKIPHTLNIQVTRQCSLLTTGVSAVYTTTLGYVPTACTSYQAVPSGILQNAWLPDGLEYIVENNKLKFRGGVYKDFSSGPSIVVLGSVSAAFAEATIVDDIFNATGLSLCGYPLPSSNANYGLKDSIYQRHGVYSYSSVVINDSVNTHVNFNLKKAGTVFQLERNYTSYRDDTNETHTGVMMSSVNTTRNIYISFEGVTIDLI